MPNKIPGGVEANSTAVQEMTEDTQQSAALSDHAEVTQPHIDIEKYDAVPEHNGSLQEVIQQFKDNPNLPMPACLRNLGFTTVNQFIERVEGTDDSTKRAPTIKEMREAKKRESEKQVATTALTIDTPKPALDTQAKPAEAKKPTASEPIRDQAQILTFIEPVPKQTALPELIASEPEAQLTELPRSDTPQKIQEEAPGSAKVEVTRPQQQETEAPEPTPAQTTETDLLPKPTEVSLAVFEEPETAIEQRLVASDQEQVVVDTADIDTTNLFDSADFPTLVESFDVEVMGTFEQLVELTLLEQDETAMVASEPVRQEAMDEEVRTDLAPEALGTLDQLTTLIGIRAEGETPNTFETVIAAASKQDLEKTLVELGTYLSETAEDDIEATLSGAFEEIIELIPYAATYGEQKINAVITPELTEKLLQLLTVLGYDNPQEILVKFVQDHSLEFLLQAIKYLYQLNNESERREFAPIHSQIIMTVGAKNRLHSLLGRMIVALVAPLAYYY